MSYSQQKSTEMKKDPDINFVTDYIPTENDLVELINGKFANVLKDTFYNEKDRFFIKNKKIIYVSYKDTFNTKPDYIIDLKGKTVLPGLFNVHCHIQQVNPTVFATKKTRKAGKDFKKQQVEFNMEECLARGITNIRDACTDSIKANTDLRDSIIDGIIKGPRIQLAVVIGPYGGYLIPRAISRWLLKKFDIGKFEYDSIWCGVIKFSDTTSLTEIRNCVDSAINSRGADLIKVAESKEQSLLNRRMIEIESELLDTIVDQANSYGMQSTIHSVSVSTFQKAVNAKFSSLAHVPRDNLLSKKDIEAFIKSGCIIDPTLSVAYDMSWVKKCERIKKRPDLIKLYEFRDEAYRALVNDFWIKELREHVLKGFDKANKRRYNIRWILPMRKIVRHYNRLPKFGFKNTKMLFDAGATFALGNDGGIQSCTPAMITHELALLDFVLNNKHGKKIFDGAEALKIATINSAKSMGIDDKFGTIEEGKTADLVIVSGNPFGNFRVIGKRVDALFMNGKLVIDNYNLEIKPNK